MINRKLYRGFYESIDDREACLQEDVDSLFRFIPKVMRYLTESGVPLETDQTALWLEIGEESSIRGKVKEPSRKLKLLYKELKGFVKCGVDYGLPLTKEDDADRFGDITKEQREFLRKAILDVRTEDSAARLQGESYRYTDA